MIGHCNYMLGKTMAFEWSAMQITSVQLHGDRMIHHPESGSLCIAVDMRDVVVPDATHW